MKFSSKSANRSLALALVVGSTLGLGVVGVTHAQYGTSGQGGSTGQGSTAGQGGSAGEGGYGQGGSGQGGSGQGGSGQGSYEQGSSAGQGSTSKSSEKFPHGIIKKEMDTGQVDQKIRVERATSKDPVVPPPVRKNEKGLVVEDPSQIQGGSIGPN